MTILYVQRSLDSSKARTKKRTVKDAPREDEPGRCKVQGVAFKGIEFGPVQGYLTQKKRPPHPRTTVGP